MKSLKQINKEIEVTQDSIRDYEYQLNNAKGWDAIAGGAYKLITSSELILFQEELNKLNKKLEELTELRVKSIIKSLK